MVKTSKQLNNTFGIMYHHSNQKVLNKSKYILYFKFFKVATLCLDGDFAHAWHSLNQLHEVATWNAFLLTGVPC